MELHPLRVIVVPTECRYRMYNETRKYSHTPRSMAVSLRSLGRVAYRPCLILQQKLAEKYSDRNQRKVLTVQSVAMRRRFFL